jgi:heterotetrameric sarcosine oxidase gamma subunit
MASGAPAPGFTLTEPASVAKLRLQAMPGSAATPPSAPASGSGSWMLSLAPRDWLAYGPAVTVTELEQVFAADIAAGAVVRADVSSALTLLELEGPQSMEILAAGCGLDFAGGAVPPGGCVQTQLFQLAVVIHRPERRLLWRLFVDRSVAKWLRAAMTSQQPGGRV